MPNKQIFLSIVTLHRGQSTLVHVIHSPNKILANLKINLCSHITSQPLKAIVCWCNKTAGQVFLGGKDEFVFFISLTKNDLNCLSDRFTSFSSGNVLPAVCHGAGLQGPQGLLNLQRE